MLTDRIFETYAPLYWAAGLPTIPLRARNKMPDLPGWSVYGTRMPDQLEMNHWMASFPNGNIGLPLGSASGLCIIDVDTEDETIIAAIRDICGPTPWVRVGKKGMALAYRWEGQKNFKLRGADGGMLCEFLGQGNQCVVPPSIHPDTGRPYTSNTNLWEVLDKIPYLGEDIEDKLRTMLGAKGFKIGAGGRSSPIDVIPSGERDVMMVRHAGYLARVVLGIDRSTKFSLFEAIQQIYHWVEGFTAKVSGDEMDPQKGVAKLLEFLMTDINAGRTMPNGWDAGLPDEWREHPVVIEIAGANADHSWTFERAKKWFDDRIAQNATSPDWVTTSIDLLFTEIAKDDHFSDPHRDALIAHVRRHSKSLGYGKRELTTLLNSKRRQLDGEELENHATIAQSVLDDMQLPGEIRFDLGQFWQWNGACFAPLDEDKIYLYVAKNVKGSMLVRRNSDYNAMVEVLEKICKQKLVQSEVRGLNFANGYVVEDLSVHEHDPKFGATFTLPFEYDRDNATRCNKWLEFLASCWGMEPDFEQRVMALQEMFAATLFGVAPNYQRAFLLFGRAGTGKTVLLRILRALLPPDAVAQLGPQTWSERFTLTDLIGKTANIVGELPENGMITGSFFKEVVEGARQRCEFKNKDPFNFTPICANWFASNYLPVSRDSSRGFIRRWLILDFNHPVAEKDQVKNLAEIIVAEERSAIAAWALEGLRRLLDQNGFTLPISHDKRVAQMRRINNSVQAFIEDNSGYVMGDGSSKCRDVYDAYSFHMRDVGRSQPVSFERFMQMLEDIDLDVSRDVIGDYVVAGLVKFERKAA